MAEAREAELALVGVDEQLTYAALAQRTNRYARWALDQKLAAGDVVCLLMPNRPDYIAIWLALPKSVALSPY